MTRTDDNATDNTEYSQISKRKTSDLKNRLDLMNKTENGIYVSIHLNKFTASRAKGMQVFYSTNTSNSKTLAQNIQKKTAEILQKDNNRVIKPGGKSTYLLYYAKIPAVIVECGFLSNNQELELLKSDEYQSKIAFCIYCGIKEYY